jgi:hypothetical protein
LGIGVAFPAVVTQGGFAGAKPYLFFQFFQVAFHPWVLSILQRYKKIGIVMEIP